MGEMWREEAMTPPLTDMSAEQLLKSYEYASLAAQHENPAFAENVRAYRAELLRLAEAGKRAEHCCGDAHLKLKSSLAMLADLGFESEEKRENGVVETIWRNRRAESAESALTEANRERDNFERLAADFNTLAFQWMERHDAVMAIWRLSPDFNRAAGALAELKFPAPVDRPALLAALAEAEKALTALTSKLRMLHDDPEYVSVWALAQSVRGPYRGLKYEEELIDAESALASIRRTPDQTKLETK
jgi:hypothetical protein